MSGKEAGKLLRVKASTGPKGLLIAEPSPNVGKISRNCVQPPGCFPSFAFLALDRWLAPGRHRGRGHASEMGGLGPRKELKTKTSFLGKAACRSVMTAGCTGDRG